MRPELKLQIITGVIMSFAMSLTLAGFFTWLNRGLSPDLPVAWFRSFAISWPIAFLLAMVVGPQARKLATRLTKP